MNKGHCAAPDTFYPLQSLTDKLTNIPFRPLSVMEAPSGFGKTTAAREYFRTFTGQEYRLHWLTLGEENRLSEWEVFCSAISRVNKAAGDELEKLSVLHDDKAFFHPPIKKPASSAGFLIGLDLLGRASFYNWWRRGTSNTA